MAPCIPPAQTCAGHHNLSVASAVFADRSQSFRGFDVGSFDFASRRCESVVRAMRRSVGLGAPKLTTNFARNSVVRQMSDDEKTAEFQRFEFKVERVVRELRAKFRGGELLWGRGTPGGLWVPGVSGARTLRGVGHGHRMITILIHIHVRST